MRVKRALSHFIVEQAARVRVVFVRRLIRIGWRDQQHGVEHGKTGGAHQARRSGIRVTFAVPLARNRAHCSLSARRLANISPRR